MKLNDVLKTLCNEIEIEPITKQQYQRAIDRFGEQLGRPPSVGDLTIATVNSYLIWLGDKYSLGPTSVSNYRTAIIRIWSFAHAPLALVDDCPTKRIRKPRKPESIVSAWSVSNVEQLLRAAAEVPGMLSCGIPAKEFLTAWVWVGYETGLRPSDLRELRWCNIDLSVGIVSVIQHKTRKIHTALIGPQSIDALRALAKYEQVYVFPLNKFGVWRWEQILYSRAEQYGFSKRDRQGIGTLRKTHATEVYRQYGLAAAADSLGHHGSTTTARQHYIDSRARKGYLPPTPRNDQGGDQKRA